MSWETLIYDLKEDGILWIRFNRPRSLNAVNRVPSPENCGRPWSRPRLTPKSR